jgi:hypothetical protein
MHPKDSRRQFLARLAGVARVIVRQQMKPHEKSLPLGRALEADPALAFETIPVLHMSRRSTGCGNEEVNSMRRETLTHVVGAMAAFCGLSLCACGGGASEPSSGESSAGGESAQYEGAIGSTDADHGKAVFDSSCGDCHPGGEADVGPSLIAEAHTPARVRPQIREGSGKMRPVSEKRLSNEDMEAVLAYLASINAVK